MLAQLNHSVDVKYSIQSNPGGFAHASLVPWEKLVSLSHSAWPYPLLMAEKGVNSLWQSKVMVEVKLLLTLLLLEQTEGDISNCIKCTLYRRYI